MIVSAYFQRHILGQHVAGLPDSSVPRKYLPCQDQCLGARAAFHQPPVHQNLVDPATRHVRAYARAAPNCTPSAFNAVATISLADSPASIICATGALWSMKRSGKHIGRSFSP